MIFFKRLKNSIGGLLRLKTQLYWHDDRGWDGRPGRVCLILDAYEGRPGLLLGDLAAVAAALDADEAYLPVATGRDASATVLLLIDGSPTWVWVDEQNTEIVTNE